MAEPAGYAHAATLATADPDLAVRLAGELREARAAIQRVRAWAGTAAPAAWSSHATFAYRAAQLDALAALDPPDGGHG